MRQKKKLENIIFCFDWQRETGNCLQMGEDWGKGQTANG